MQIKTIRLRGRKSSKWFEIEYLLLKIAYKNTLTRISK